MKLQELISSFSVENLTRYLRSKITSLEIQKKPLSIANVRKMDGFSNLVKLGEAELKDETSEDLVIIACECNNPLSDRSSRKKQFEIAKSVLGENYTDGAIFVFYDKEGKFRFSFIRRLWDGKGDKKYSPWKRYTYLVTPDQTNKTFIDRITNCKFSSLDNIQEAFSVEKLTKEFYSELFAWYERTLSDEIGITFPHNPETPEDDRHQLQEQVIRLITRLLFVWFIKQKQFVPDYLFDENQLKKILKNFDPHSETDGSYYNAILQNLFFATLNQPVTERRFAEETGSRDIKTLYRYSEMFKISEDEVLEKFRPIPFLNGGLFECLDKEDKDGNQYFLDGFSRNKTKAKGRFKHRAFIPNTVFFDEETGIIPLLKRYNFTVEESAFNEVQVALDPELLGNVFENLLGAFNEETKETARNQTGSFYTPREIVSYMVNESLIHHLKGKISPKHEPIIRKLFETEELPEEFKTNKKLSESVVEALRSVKILDPACGSGAFPMGILNKIVEVLEKLDHKDETSLYEQKLHIIEQCIYGVDIQSIAVQISKLRFFISLVVEQGTMDISKPKSNYEIITLPNLETKFVAADALLAGKVHMVQGNLFDGDIDELKEKLLRIRKEHFYAKNVREKKRLREEDNKSRNKLSSILEENGEFSSDEAKNFASWNPYDQNCSTEFFDPDWMFGLNEGFDIVIGNPPYIQLQKDGGKLSKKYQACDYKTFARTGDIYSLFYERGFQLLKTNGVLCFITSNKWMRAESGEKTRKFLTEQTNPVLLIDFAGQKIFEAATVDTNVLLFSKSKNSKNTQACTVKENSLNNLSDYFRQFSNLCDFSGSESWVILSPIERRIKEKIERVGTPLKDWDIKIYRGVLTGYNEAFIIDGKKRQELIDEDPKSDEIIRPILRGRDIKRYGYDFADLWLIATFPSLKLNIDQYPAIKKHLLSFGIERLEQTGKTHKINGETIKARKKTNNKWFETQDSISYWEDFYKQKIIYPDIMRMPKQQEELDNYPYFYYDTKCFFVEATNFMMTGSDIDIIFSFLASQLGFYIFSRFYTGPQFDETGFRYKKAYLANLLIPALDAKNQNKIRMLIKNLENDDSLKTGKEIDKFWYEIVALNQEEITSVDSYKTFLINKNQIELA